MNSKLQRQFEKLEKAKADIVTLVSGLDDDQMRRAASGGWSISQILIHIITSEKLALQYMQKKSLGADKLSDAGMVQATKSVLLKISQRIPVKYKAPGVIQRLTPTAPPKDQLFSLWDNQRELLKAFLKDIDSQNVDKMIFKHPFAGMLSASQGVAFLREHIIHHTPQIKRAMRKLSL